MKALEGIKVVDLTNFESGPTCTEDLGFLGADVYKIERVPKSGTSGRNRSSAKGDTIAFTVLNANKKSISVDMKSPEGKEIIWKLIDECDVLVENMGPGSVDRLGFSYEAVHKRNPRMIYTSIKGFGKGSPWENYPAFDPIAQATGGAMALNGPLDGPPTLIGPNVGDYGVGHFTCIGILAALIEREKTGEGQFVEGAMQDVIACCIRGHFEPFYTRGIRRVGNYMPLEDVAPHNLYRCKGDKDTDCALIYCSRVPSSTNYVDLMKIIGREDLAEDPRMATPQSRFEYREMLDQAITDWTSVRDKYEVMDVVASAGIPCGAVLGLDEVIDNEFLRSRGTIVDIQHPYYGKIAMPTFPIKMSGSKVEVTQAPNVGAHTKEVLQGVLGLSDEEVAALKEKGIVGYSN